MILMNDYSASNLSYPLTSRCKNEADWADEIWVWRRRHVKTYSILLHFWCIRILPHGWKLKIFEDSNRGRKLRIENFLRIEENQVSSFRGTQVLKSRWVDIKEFSSFFDLQDSHAGTEMIVFEPNAPPKSETFCSTPHWNRSCLYFWINLCLNTEVYLYLEHFGIHWLSGFRRKEQNQWIWNWVVQRKHKASSWEHEARSRVGDNRELWVDNWKKWQN